jgi:rRNA maturation endonuclease Nob1
MIRLDITTAIFFYALFSVLAILIVWTIAAYRKGRKVSSRDVNYIWKCALCAHVYVDSVHEDISECPLCGSYNKKGDLK